MKSNDESGTNRARVHLHLTVADLARSREFYVRFLGARPVKERPGYLKFLPALGPLNLALTQGAREGGTSPVSHLGIEVNSTRVVQEELSRVRREGLPVVTEMGVECCHANQDKFWVTDPDGVEWEVYHLNYDLEPAQPGVHVEPRPLRADDPAASGAKAGTETGGCSARTHCCTTIEKGAQASDASDAGQASSSAGVSCCAPAP